MKELLNQLPYLIEPLKRTFDNSKFDIDLYTNYPDIEVSPAYTSTGETFIKFSTRALIETGDEDATKADCAKICKAIISKFQLGSPKAKLYKGIKGEGFGFIETDGEGNFEAEFSFFLIVNPLGEGSTLKVF